MLITVDTRSPSRCYAFDNHSKQLCHANDNAPMLTNEQYIFAGIIYLEFLIDRLLEKFRC